MSSNNRTREDRRREALDLLKGMASGAEPVTRYHVDTALEIIDELDAKLDEEEARARAAIDTRLENTANEGRGVAS